MNKLAIKFGTGVATAALIMTAFAGSAFAQTTLTIENNGAGSTNEIKVGEKCKTELSQNSKTKVNMVVKAKSNTGGNTIDGTTGDGDVTIDTGSATTTVGLTVRGGDNTATSPDCCCDDPGSLDVAIKDNGAGSTNEVKSRKKTKLVVEQKSKTKVRARVNAKSKTGNNEVLDTTGDGVVEINTDDATTTVTGVVTGGDNNL